MNKKIHYLIGFSIIAAVIGYLMTTTFKSSLQYYVTVSELRAAEPKYQKRVLKVAGKAGPIEKVVTPEKITYKFTVLEGEQVISVTYAGLAPDTFKEGADVVATGVLKEDGSFEATELLAKCASKYEAQIK